MVEASASIALHSEIDLKEVSNKEVSNKEDLEVIEELPEILETQLWCSARMTRTPKRVQLAPSQAKRSNSD